MSWLHDYMAYTKQDEAPAQYHLWVALTIAGHAIGRRLFYLQQEKRVFFPGQIMTILIGPSGLRKSSAIEVGRDLLMEARNQVEDQCRIHIIADRLSTEALYQAIVPPDDDPEDPVADAVGLLIASEMGGTFGNAAYMEGLTTALTSLHDASFQGYDKDTDTLIPYYRESHFLKDGGIRRLKNPTVGLLAATTPSGLRDEMKGHIRQTGFLARVMSIWESSTTKGPNAGWEAFAPDVSPLRGKLTKGLAQMTTLEGRVELEPGLQGFAEEWYRQLWKRCQVERNPLLCTFLNRAQGAVLRVAMILGACDHLELRAKGRVLIRRGNLEAAIKLVERVEKGLVECYADLIERNKARSAEELLLAIFQRAARSKRPLVERWIVQKKMAKYGHRKDTVDPALKHLLTTGQIKEKESRGYTGGRAYRFVKPVPGPWSVPRPLPAVIPPEEPPPGVEEEMVAPDPVLEAHWAEQLAMAAEDERRKLGFTPSVRLDDYSGE